jgi:hypothetical protein
MVRSAAPPRVSNHEAIGYAVMIPLKLNTLYFVSGLISRASRRR